ncbi:MAG: hypothetical protein KAR01_06675 [Desulfocapsa sp.]|nr:hypothetical protein [Desulfocapsa sp.]
MDKILNVLPDGVALVVLAVCVVLLLIGVFLSSTMRSQVTKGSIYLLIIAGVLAGYYFFTGNSPADIPTSVDTFFNAPREPEKGTHKYYTDPEKRYGDSIKD